MKKILLMSLLLFLTACSSISEKEMVTIQQIERDLNTIVTSNIVNHASSNPNDYITAHLDEFDRIVSKGEITLNHFLDKFATSNENGLKEYIMAAVCVKILEDKNPVQDWSSGREWYEKYMDHQAE